MPSCFLNYGDAVASQGGWVPESCSYQSVIRAVLFIGGQEEKGCGTQIPWLGVPAGCPACTSKCVKKLVAPGI